MCETGKMDMYMRLANYKKQVEEAVAYVWEAIETGKEDDYDKAATLVRKIEGAIPVQQAMTVLHSMLLGAKND
jgi:hypothetical protein